MAGDKMVELSNREYYEILIYSVALIGVVIVNCFLYLRAKKIMLVQYFFRLEILVSLWMIAKIFKIIANDYQNLWFWVLVEYIGICYFSVEFFGFCYIYKHEKVLPKGLHIFLLAIATINYIVLFTNPYHHLFYRHIRMIHSIKGPYFYVHTTFSYMLALFGIFILISSKMNKNLTKRDKTLLTVGLLFPLMINLLYISRLIHVPFDLTPITYNIMMLSFAYAAFRNDYFDVQLVTRMMIMDNLYEGIVILDKDHRILEYNRRMNELLVPVVHIKKYLYFEEVFKRFEPFVDNYETVAETYKAFIRSPIAEMKTDIEVCFSGEQYTYMFSLQKTYSTNGEYTGNIIKFVDMTEYHTLLYELENKNYELQEINMALNENISVKKRLVVEKERNRASKEVHDILGHSVTLVISLLEIIHSTYEKEPDFAKEKIKQAMEITRNGLKQLKQSLTKKKDRTIETDTLIEDLEKLIDEFTLSGVEVEFITNHYLIRINPKYYDTIYRICQESMTNALRHGHASKITIAVRFSESSVDIIIADNGLGCSMLEKGNGLKGMEQRINELNGFFSCGSPDGVGFNLHANIPVARALSNINEAEPI